MFTSQVDQPDWIEAIEKLAVGEAEKMYLVCEVVGAEGIAYLRSLTNEIRPSVRVPDTGAMTGPRQAHPGHWADVTSHLAGSYGYEVERISKHEVLLTFSNSAEYAKALEAKDGFYVLSGITDPGGPVEKILVRAANRHAPGWEVRRG